MIRELKWLFRRSDSIEGIVSECRRCGSKVGRESETCPQCGAADIVRYDLR